MIPTRFWHRPPPHPDQDEIDQDIRKILQDQEYYECGMITKEVRDKFRESVFQKWQTMQHSTKGM